jgi:hypothetical protein
MRKLIDNFMEKPVNGNYFYNYHYFSKIKDVEEYRNVFGNYPQFTFNSPVSLFYEEKENRNKRYVYIYKNDDPLRDLKGFKYNGNHIFDDCNFITISYLFNDKTIVNLGFEQSILDFKNAEPTGDEVNKYEDNFYLSSIGITSDTREDFNDVITVLKRYINDNLLELEITYDMSIDDHSYRQHVIVKNTGALAAGYDLETLDIKPNTVLYEDCYNTSPDKHTELISIYNEHVNKFLVMYNGKPGTGKTNFLKHLSYNFAKDGYMVISIPSGMLNKFLDPEFIRFITTLVNRYKRIVFKIEDGESLLFSRGSDKQNSPEIVSVLLNIIDGDTYFDSDAKIIFFMTFNTNIESIDPAFLRSGRLFYRYEFKEISVEKANKLLSHHDCSFRTEVPMTIADVFFEINKAKNERINHIIADLKNEATSI